MSDEETKKGGGYRLEYASSGRAKCKGPKPCSGTAIGKGELRFGSQVDFRGNVSFAWRHWGCVTPAIITNMKQSFEDADELDGFDDLKDKDKERIRKAWEEGKVADEDIPESARGGGDEVDEEDKPKKKKAPAKKKAKKDGGEEDKPPKKAAKKSATTTAASKKKKKHDSESEGENFMEAMDNVSDDDVDDNDVETGKKRKRPTSKQTTKGSSSKKPAPKRSKKKIDYEESD